MRDDVRGKGDDTRAGGRKAVETERGQSKLLLSCGLRMCTTVSVRVRLPPAGSIGDYRCWSAAAPRDGATVGQQWLRVVSPRRTGPAKPPERQASLRVSGGFRSILHACWPPGPFPDGSTTSATLGMSHSSRIGPCSPTGREAKKHFSS